MQHPSFPVFTVHTHKNTLECFFSLSLSHFSSNNTANQHTHLQRSPKSSSPEKPTCEPLIQWWYVSKQQCPSVHLRGGGVHAPKNSPTLMSTWLGHSRSPGCLRVPTGDSVPMRQFKLSEWETWGSPHNGHFYPHQSHFIETDRCVSKFFHVGMRIYGVGGEGGGGVFLCVSWERERRGRKIKNSLGQLETLKCQNTFGILLKLQHLKEKNKRTRRLSDGSQPTDVSHGRRERVMKREGESDKEIEIKRDRERRVKIGLKKCSFSSGPLHRCMCVFLCVGACVCVGKCVCVCLLSRSEAITRRERPGGAGLRPGAEQRSCNRRRCWRPLWKVPPTRDSCRLRGQEGGQSVTHVTTETRCLPPPPIKPLREVKKQAWI